MSTPRLKTFLNKLDRELQSYSEYRKILNRKPHSFVFNRRSLLTQTMKQLEHQNLTIPSKAREDIKKIVDAGADALINELETIAGGKIPRPGGKLTMLFDEGTDVPIPNYLTEKGLTAQNFTVFRKVKFAYKASMNEMFLNLQNYLKGHTELSAIKTKSGTEKKSIMHFYDAGHKEGAGVFEKFIDQATLKIAEGMTSEIEGSSEDTRDQMIAQLNAQSDLKLKIVKLDHSESVEIQIESSFLNRSRGSKVGQQSTKLRKAIRVFLAKNDITQVQGSDSIRDRQRKKVANKVLDPFKKLAKSKNITLNLSEDFRLKPSSTSPAEKRVKGKTKRVSSPIGYSPSVKSTTAARVSKPARSNIALMQLLNSKLPETVKRNMISPRLESQTGRFASSTRVTDITTTRKGFTSIGYTYEKEPYGVFESTSGSRFASLERDPRRLIEGSIREIAAELAIGRFYTRRM